MAFDSHKNFGYSTVAATAPAISGTTMVLASNFSPAPTPPFNIVVWPAAVNPTSSNAEVCRVTANSSGTLTIVRAQEGSSGRNIIVGDQVSAAITAKTITDIEARVSRIDANVFYVEDYGAVGDGVTNDTAAIQAAIDAAFAAAPSYGGAIVQFQATQYAVNSAPRTDRSGNAILAFPTTPTGEKVMLRGPDVRGMTCVITTTSTAAYDGTHGQPSVIGGPTNGVFANIVVGVEGIVVSLPANPSISAFDFQWIGGGTYLDNVGVSTADPTTAAPTVIRQFGIRTPAVSNFGPIHFGTIVIYGCYTGLVATSEHMGVDYMYIQYCINGIGCASGTHANHIGYYSSEKVKYHIAGVPTTANPVSADGYLVIDLWDTEDETGWYTRVNHLYDTAGTLHGHANVFAINAVDTLSVTTGTRFTLRDIGLAPGYHSTLTIAGSGSPMTLYRDTTYYVTGGTVTAIAVDGQTTGLTSGGFTVPSGIPFTVTYSVAPTFKAICL